MSNVEDIRYPIGRFIATENTTEVQRQPIINLIADMPSRLREAVKGLSKEQLNTPYREGGWTVQQIVHHLADAEMNAYIRFKRGLTENHPVVGSFHEDLWAELNDYIDVPIETSLLLLDTLHQRFTSLLINLQPLDFKRMVTSPTHGNMSLEVALQRFSWHANHHIAQIISFRNRKQW